MRLKLGLFAHHLRVLKRRASFLDQCIKANAYREEPGRRYRTAQDDQQELDALTWVIPVVQSVIDTMAENRRKKR